MFPSPSHKNELLAFLQQMPKTEGYVQTILSTLERQQRNLSVAVARGYVTILVEDALDPNLYHETAAVVNSESGWFIILTNGNPQDKTQVIDLATAGLSQIIPPLLKAIDDRAVYLYNLAEADQDKLKASIGKVFHR